MLNTPIDSLDKLIGICLKDDEFEAENAEKFISNTMGYEQFKQENPYQDLLEMVTQIIEYGFDITTKVHDIDFIHDEKSQEYLKNVKTRFEAINNERDLLHKQLVDCETAIEKYSHFKKLDLDLGEILDCKFITMRFGHISKDGYNKLKNVYGDNPYVMLQVCSEDKTGYWGAYFAPKDKVSEIDSIFVVLNFDRLYIPGAVGKIDQIEKMLRENIDIVKQQKLEVENRISDILKKESGEIVSLYFSLLKIEEIYSYKKYAVKNNNDSFFVGTIPSSYEKTFIEKIKDIDSVFITTEKIKKTKKVRQ